MSATREAILTATLELVSTRGLHDTPISKIAKQAKVSVGSIYVHFENKEVLIENLYRSIKTKVVKHIIDGFDVKEDYKSNCLRIWMNIADYYMNKRKEVEFLEHYENTPMSRKVIEEAFLTTLQPIFLMINKAINENVIENYTLEIMNSIFFEVIISLSKKHVRGKIELTEELLKRTFNTCWKGIEINHIIF